LIENMILNGQGKMRTHFCLASCAVIFRKWTAFPKLQERGSNVGKEDRP
jgi:hypothetical protein